MTLRCTECDETEYHKEGCTIAEWVEMAQSSDVADRAFANFFSDLWRGAVVEVDEELEHVFMDPEDALAVSAVLSQASISARALKDAETPRPN